MSKTAAVAAMLCLFVLAGASATKASAPATSPWRSVPGLVSVYSTVGDRYVAYGRPEASPRHIFALDTKTLRTRSFVVPRTCGLAGVYGPSVSGTHALVRCRKAAILVDLRSGKATNLGKPSTEGDSEWYSVGRYWLQGSCPESGDTSPTCLIYRNLETGEVRTLLWADGSRDLDDPDLGLLTLCAPFGAEYRPGPWQRFGTYVLLDDPLAVGRCGRGLVKKLPERAFTTDTSFVGGWVTYSYYRSCDRHAYAYNVQSRRSYRWRTPSIRGAKCADDAVHTKYAVIVPLIARVRSDQSVEDFTYRLIARRLPRR